MLYERYNGRGELPSNTAQAPIAGSVEERERRIVVWGGRHRVHMTSEKHNERGHSPCNLDSLRIRPPRDTKHFIMILLKGLFIHQVNVSSGTFMSVIIGIEQTYQSHRSMFRAGSAKK
ncbi:hypothetical protein PILCRDRAFT_433201 [Piloderma croceum F 1598]|uniref:Uncharacterized protein n=1 Tax=Piloderma croceum (strain F 1598) TaxID=765440 RepID=A0A0C3C2C3_PILCF|nr:hypothetical protein PILCRDRAFT_433201 [Piloderma croceum F 1598]